jgi:hypothetical protein
VLPAGTDEDRVSAMAAALLSLGERTSEELARIIHQSLGGALGDPSDGTVKPEGRSERMAGGGFWR